MLLEQRISRGRCHREWPFKDRSSVIDLWVMVVQTHTQLNVLGSGSLSSESSEPAPGQACL